MEAQSSPMKKQAYRFGFHAIFFLFFIQLFSDFVESVYIFALMTLSININVLSVLFFFSSIFLLLFGKKISKNCLFILNIIMVLARITEPLFDTSLRMLISGLGVGAFMMLLPGYLFSSSRQDGNGDIEGYLMGLGLVFAMLTSILFRILNSTIDISTFSWFQGIGWILAAVEVYMMFMMFFKSDNDTTPSENNTANAREISSDRKKQSTRAILGNIFGFSSIILILYFVFSATNILSRWTERSYVLISIFIAVWWTLFSVLLLFQPAKIMGLKSWMRGLLNIIFIAGLVITIILNQVSFPASPGGYPLGVGRPSWLEWIPLAVVILTSPIIFIDAIVLFTEIINKRPSLPKLAGGFALGGFYILLIVFALIFTSVWGFVAPVSFYLRDQFWSVILVIAIILFIAIIIPKTYHISTKKMFLVKKDKKSAAILLGIICIGTISGSLLIEAHPPEPAVAPTTLKIQTYNLQQGVNDYATKNYDGQLALIREIDADIIGLQESSKIAGNSDVVRYFANKLDMYSYFGPRGVTGTTGVAVLSKYPIVSAKTYYHYSADSDRKQTATTETEILVGTETYTVYVTHTFGSMDAKSMLINNTLELAEGKENVLFIGDFNFRQNSEAYNLTTEVFVDAWLDQFHDAIDNTVDPAINATRRIDHIFVSPDVVITECRYVDWANPDSQSDHPTCWAEIAL